MVINLSGKHWLYSILNHYDIAKNRTDIQHYYYKYLVWYFARISEVVSSLSLMSHTVAHLSWNVGDSFANSDTTSVMKSMNCINLASFIMARKPFAFPSPSADAPFWDGSCNYKEVSCLDSFLFKYWVTVACLDSFLLKCSVIIWYCNMTSSNFKNEK